MKKIALLLGVTLALAACHTIEGFGEDVSDGARAIDRAI
ncbi:MAG: entericidin EcnA/B family protein [Boseongicola sp.]